MKNVKLGYRVKTGEHVEIPVRHMCITGQTQEAGKTTALEGLIQRSGLQAITFITKRGEGSFRSARRVHPYFREQADWQFVASILEASRGEKLKFERAWIIRASKGARSLYMVQQNVRSLMRKAKGLSADVYLTLDAYLDVVVPTISKVKWATTVSLAPGVNVMDLTMVPSEMQHLVIKSTLDWVLEHARDTVVVIPEAWKFIPQGRGTPVKLSAEAFIRQAAGLRNYLWLDSQDIGGIEKTILRSVPVWVLGVQREANEIKRTLSNIPSGTAKPSAADLATLELGQFYACWGRHVIPTYAQPTWVSDNDAIEVSITGNLTVLPGQFTSNGTTVNPGDDDMTSAQEAKLDRLIDQMTVVVQNLGGDGRGHDLKIERITQTELEDRVEPPTYYRDPSDQTGHLDALYQEFKARLIKEAPALLKVLVNRPELDVEVERVVVRVDGFSTRGRIARLIHEGFFAEAQTSATVAKELAKRGRELSNIELGNELKWFVENGFFRRDNKWITLVPEAVVNVVGK